MIRIDNPRIIEELLAKDEPIFINRLGGSDARIMFENFRNKNGVKSLSPISVDDAIRYISIKNGYYDTSKDPLTRQNNLFTFFEKLDECYRSNPYQSAACICANPNNPAYRPVFDYFKDQKGFYFGYKAIENTVNFLKSFQIFSKGKKLLLVNPFVNNIRDQIPRLKQLYAGKIDVDCIFKYLETPITYYDLKIGYMNIPHNNFLETADYLCKQIDAEDYDIALLGCGSYAHLLGEHIKRRGKKAIYIGGVLPAYFGLISDRAISSHAFPSFFDFRYVVPIGGIKHTFDKYQESLSTYLYHEERYFAIVGLYNFVRKMFNIHVNRNELDDKQALLFFIYSVKPYSTNIKRLRQYLRRYDYDKFIAQDRRSPTLSRREAFLDYLRKYSPT